MKCPLKIKPYKILSISLICIFNLYAQFDESDFSQGNILGKDKSGVGMDLLNLENQTPDRGSINVPVDPKKYIVDSGDQFTIKIDKVGPAYKIHTPIVTPDGYITLPEVKGIYVKDMILEEALKKIKYTIKKKFPDNLVEANLFGIHRISVTLLGAVEKQGKIELLSSDRLFDAFAESNIEEKIVKEKEQPQTTQDDVALIPEENKEETKLKEVDIQSIRHTKIIRNGSAIEYDLLTFMTTGNEVLNPYLKHNDVIYFPYKNNESATIEVKGSVKNPLTFEYKIGDVLKDALLFAGGMLYEADSNKIELVRFTNEKTALDRMVLKLPKDKDFSLKPNDRIFIRRKPKFENKLSVSITGEVKFPGDYAIEERKTTLLDVITMAGGLTEKASLSRSRIIREYDQQSSYELWLLRRQGIDHKNKLEHPLLRYVTCDFEKLIYENDTTQNIILRDKDIIEIPIISKSVYVRGGVIYPGVFLLNESWDVLDYINEAGGFSDRAYESRVKIIKAKTGAWVDMPDIKKVEENDLIFIPESFDTDYYALSKDILIIATQVATLVLLYINITR